MLKVPVLSTMVVLHTFGMKLNTDELLHKLPINEILLKVEKRGILRRGESKRDRIKRRNPKVITSSGFGNNSVTLVLLDDGGGALPNKEITVKLFHNGVFHMTGILDERYETSSLGKLQAIFETLPPECIKEGGWTHLSRRVVLMNYTTELPANSKLSRLSLQKFFQEKGIRADFEPDVSPCVKIVFPERWTACVFRTGKINLTALTSKEDCASFVEKLEPQLSEYLSRLS
jgi:hypothetical protein